MAEIILKKDPKIPSAQRTVQTVEEQILLEALAPEFAEFITRSGELALSDARSNMPLKVPRFQQSPSRTLPHNWPSHLTSAMFKEAITFKPLSALRAG
jgi:hypothetical protein